MSYSLSPHSAYVLEDDNLSPKVFVCTPQPPVRQYLWYPASAAVDDVADYYCTLYITYLLTHLALLPNNRRNPTLFVDTNFGKSLRHPEVHNGLQHFMLV